MVGVAGNAPAWSCSRNRRLTFRLHSGLVSQLAPRNEKVEAWPAKAREWTVDVLDRSRSADKRRDSKFIGARSRPARVLPPLSPARQAGESAVLLPGRKWWELVVMLHSSASDLVLRRPLYRRLAGATPCTFALRCTRCARLLRTLFDSLGTGWPKAMSEPTKETSRMVEAPGNAPGLSGCEPDVLLLSPCPRKMAGRLRAARSVLGFGDRAAPLVRGLKMVRSAGYAPASRRWQRRVLLLNDDRSRQRTNTVPA